MTRRDKMVLSALIATGALAFGLSGCKEEGPGEKAGKAVDKAAGDAAKSVDKAADKVKDAVKDTKSP